MSSENVELVHKLLEVYNERSFDENMHLIDPGFVWDVSRIQLPDGGTFTGRDELTRFRETWSEGFEGEHVEAEDIADAGERVVVMIHHRGRGKLSKIEVDQRYAMVWALKDGRAVRMDMYSTWEEALEAAGVEEHVSSEGTDH